MKFNKYDKQSVSDIFDTALEHFPYDLSPTGCAMGDIEPSDEPFEEFSEEFTFKVGHILDKPVVAGGWIDVRQDFPDEEIYISGFFGIASNGDFADSKILDEGKALLGHYDLEAETWELEIDRY
ncbi:MAG: hypothetical protein AAFV93_13775 [Chloroflexota bacterium]